MSDSPVNPYEKPKKLQVKLPPIHIEAIRARSSVRYSAANLLSDIAEKSFPQVTYNDEVIEKLRAIGCPNNQDAPDTNAVSRTSLAEEQSKQPETRRSDISIDVADSAPVTGLDSNQKEEKTAQRTEEAEELGSKAIDITAIRQAVKDAFEGKKAA